ncbi:MAG: preprotein translocase subunit YajC [Deltaproteobacteria bacterium]|nr:preprotein translocase subunit YajC [Deltaproteobacteria bacterium]
MIDMAYAMGSTPGQAGGDGIQSLIQFLPIVLIFVVFYFLLIRPQQKKAKEHKTLLENLKKGDSVITQGGIYGKVVAIQDQVVILEIADKVRVRMARPYIAGLASTPPPPVEPNA